MTELSERKGSLYWTFDVEYIRVERHKMNFYRNIDIGTPPTHDDVSEQFAEEFPDFTLKAISGPHKKGVVK